MANTAKTIDQLTDRYGARYALTCGISKYFPEMKGTSKVFWVEGNLGSDTAPGLGQTPDAPLATITKALDLCTANTNDYIFIMNTYETESSYPIEISKSFIHLIGAWGNKSPMWIHGDKAAGDNPAIEFVAGGANCELAYLELGAGTTKGGIEVATNGLWANYIHHCRFGMSLGMGAKNGIRVHTTGEMINWIIENCRFGTSLTGNAIDIIASAPNITKGCIIRNNQFQVASGDRGINCAAGVDFDDGGIYDNIFELEGDAANGEAVYFASGAKGNVHGNAAWTVDGVIPVNNPFFDAGTTNMSWGANIRGGGVATGPYLATPTDI